MKYLAIIPARAGSKGIKNKNIHLLMGKPLICYTLDYAKELYDKYSIDVLVSTNMEEILNLSINYPDFMFKRRSEELSGDKVSMDLLLYELILQTPNINELYSGIILLQPTNPFRTLETFNNLIKAYESSNDADLVLSLSKQYKDIWYGKDDIARRVNPLEPRNRHERTPVFEENSTFYLIDLKSFLKSGSIVGKKNLFVISDVLESIDINEMFDILYAEFIYNFFNNDYN
jgi:CMP-N-acetylneuraminic acid synthetase